MRGHDLKARGTLLTDLRDRQCVLYEYINMYLIREILIPRVIFGMTKGFNLKL